MRYLTVILYVTIQRPIGKFSNKDSNFKWTPTTTKKHIQLQLKRQKK